MRFIKAVIFVLILEVIAAGVYGAMLIRRGFAANAEPSRLEKVVARTVRDLSIPSAAAAQKNPYPATADNVKEGMEHWADHCAECHSNNGDGVSTIGPNLYPKAPDMRQAATQDLTDGQLYYIIQNGVRLTGMPGWGDSHTPEDTWKLVLFVRHLPQLTTDEEKQMRALNPKGEDERAEEEEEEKIIHGFNGSDSDASATLTPASKPAKPAPKHTH